MAWSTREIAQLAGTTLRAVRYYHEVGLLDPPIRAVNGYKQYDVSHLLRVLRIRRLLELGMTLDQIRDMVDVDAHPAEQLEELDARARESIEQLERVRFELKQLLDTPAAPVDLPVELARVASRDNATARDLKMLAVLSRFLSSEERADLARAFESTAMTEADRDFEELSDESSDDEREDLARRLLPSVLAAKAIFPGPPTFAPGERGSLERRALSATVAEIYTEAQHDVLRRVVRLEVEHAAERAMGDADIPST